MWVCVCVVHLCVYVQVCECVVHLCVCMFRCVYVLYICVCVCSGVRMSCTFARVCGCVFVLGGKGGVLCTHKSACAFSNACVWKCDCAHVAVPMPPPPQPTSALVNHISPSTSHHSGTSKLRWILAYYFFSSPRKQAESLSGWYKYLHFWKLCISKSILYIIHK